ncbi:hypothetical protein R2294_002803 [Cronobacter dublinensis]|nr:hypothetical protein [Cronobacter dublinensis]
MPKFKNCLMDTLYYDEAPWVDYPCEVSIEDGLISVEYVTEDGRFMYSGHEQTPGVYILKGNDDCDATLYWSDKTRVMYGGWVSQGYRGLWKITLGTPTPANVA